MWPFRCKVTQPIRSSLTKIFFRSDCLPSWKFHLVAQNMANVGAPKPADVCKPHLLVYRELPITDHGTVSRLLNDDMAVLCPNGTQVLLLLTDAAPYMVKAGQTFQVFYPNMVHVTCLAHALHCVDLPTQVELINMPEKEEIQSLVQV